MRIEARGDNYNVTIEVGPIDPADPDRFEFGMTAKASRSVRWGSDVPTTEVQFPAIGSHDPATARKRLAAYEAAIRIAEMLNEMPGLTSEAVVSMLDGKVFEEVFAAPVEANRRPVVREGRRAQRLIQS